MLGGILPRFVQPSKKAMNSQSFKPAAYNILIFGINYDCYTCDSREAVIVPSARRYMGHEV